MIGTNINIVDMQEVDQNHHKGEGKRTGRLEWYHSYITAKLVYY